MFKLIATDLDDTLLNNDEVISDENREALTRAAAAGIQIVIASGRSYSSTRQYIAELGLKGLTVSLNGACIHDPEDSSLVAGFPIDRIVTQEMMRDIEPFRIHTNFYSGDKVFCTGPSERASFYARMNRIRVEYVNTFETLAKTEDAGKLLWYAEPEELQPIKELLDQKYGESLNIVFSKPYFLEATDKKASKGAALLKIAELRGINPDEIMAIGDSENDISMLKAAGLGVAMGNASEKIKSAADAVTRSNHDNGVAYAIKKFVFSEVQEQEVE